MSAPAIHKRAYAENERGIESQSPETLQPIGFDSVISIYSVSSHKANYIYADVFFRLHIFCR